MPGPLIIIQAGVGAQPRPRGSSNAVEQIRDVETKLRKLERWRRCPRHENARWAHLLPPEEEDEELSEKSESLTPVLDAQHSDLTTGQTGQTGQTTTRITLPSSPTENMPCLADMTDPANKSKDKSKDKLGLDGKDVGVVAQGADAEEAGWYYCSWEFKDAITEFFEEPTSSDEAYVVSMVVLITIAISIVAMCVETLPQLEHYACCKDGAFLFFYVLEVTCITIFTVEYLTRLYGARDKLGFMTGPMNVVDLLAILPFYIELAAASLSGLDILKMFRLVRVFRVFKLSKHNKDIETCFGALFESRAIFGLMLFLLVILCIVFASFAFNFEQDGTDPWGGPTGFTSIPAAMWWCIVTVMMVGYGDVIPTTIPGKCTAALCIVVGIMVMALPISVIGTNFSQAWDARKDEELAALPPPSEEETKERMLENLEKVSENITKFNNGIRDQIDILEGRYTEEFLPTVDTLWSRFKRRVVTVSISATEYKNERFIRKKFLELLTHREVMTQTVELIEEVRDHGKVRQFERAKINLKWSRDCMEKSKILQKDIKAMCTILKV